MSELHNWISKTEYFNAKTAYLNNIIKLLFLMEITLHSSYSLTHLTFHHSKILNIKHANISTIVHL